MLSRSIMCGLLCVVGGYACASGSEAVGAGAGGSGGASGFGGASDGGDVPLAALVLESEASVALMPSAQSEIIVRYVGAHDAPIGDADVSFTLVGGAHDSGLSRLVSTTDGAGHASARLIAGVQAASFQVRISAANATPVVIDVAVSDRGFGNLRVAAPYDGVRLMTRRRVTLFAGQTCAGLDALSSPDRQSNLTSDSEEARFIGLPAETRYAVVAVAFGVHEVTLAHGCVDDVVIVADSEVAANVTLQDVDLRPWGDYDLDVALQTSSVADALAETIRTQPMPGMPMVIVTPAQLLLTALDELLRSDPLALTKVAAADVLRQLRGTTGADLDLQAALDTQMQGPTAAQAWLADQIRGELATIDLRFGFRIMPGTTDLPDATVAWTLQRASTESSLTVLGVIEHVIAQPTASTVTPSFVWSRDQMTTVGGVPSVFGALTVEAIDAVIDGSGATGRTRVRELLGCPTLAAWVDQQAEIKSACDATCVTAACDVVMSTMLSGLQTGLMAVDASRPVISIGATFDMRDSVGDGEVDGLDCQMLMATWEPDPSLANATGSYMTGTGSAVRVGFVAP